MRNNLFSKNKKWGIISLFSIIVLAFITFFIIDKQKNQTDNFVLTDVTEDWMKNKTQSNVNYSELENKEFTNNISNTNHSEIDALSKSIEYSPSKFDPNTASAEVMLANGVPPNAVKRIINYRNKNGKFYSKEKLLNFGIDEETFKKISPYIHIAEKNSNHSSTSSSYKNNYSPKPEPTNLNLNQATQEQLMEFKGIGPGFSKRIVEYRENLGGFLHIEQLKEVYGLPDSVYLHIKDKLVIDPTLVKKININTATQEELAKHPYIRKFMAEKIIQFRNDVKEFKSIQELRQIPLINEEKYRKIVPYISI